MFEVCSAIKEFGLWQNNHDLRRRDFFACRLWWRFAASLSDEVSESENCACACVGVCVRECVWESESRGQRELWGHALKDAVDFEIKSTLKKI